MNYLHKKYYNLSDEKLVEIYKHYVEIYKHYDDITIEILISRYIGFIRSKCAFYYIKGAEKEDIIQEGLIGLFKAVKSYDSRKNSSFQNFAIMCINRNIFTAIKNADRKKYDFDNNAISIYTELDKNTNKQIIDVFSTIKSCEYNVIYNEENKLLKKYMFEILSNLELESIILYYNGFSYKEISNKLNKSYKSIDAAINRAKTKLRRKLDKDEYLFILAA